MAFNTGNPIGSIDPRDLIDNAPNLDLAVNSSDATWTDRLGQVRPTLKRLETDYPLAGAYAEQASLSQIAAEQAKASAEQSAIDAAGKVTEAETAKNLAALEADRAEAARDAAFVNADIYPDVATGRAAVADGEQFQVVAGDEIARFRRISASTHAEVARYPSAAQVDVLSSTTVRGAPGKNKFNPADTVDNTALDGSGLPFTASGRNVSGFIPIIAGLPYATTAARKLCWYSADKVYISMQGALGEPAPANAAYARVDINTSDKTIAQLEQSPVRTPFEPYRVLASEKTIPAGAIRPGAVGSDDLGSFVVKPGNLADVTFLNCHDGTLLAGAIVQANGLTVGASADYEHTDWIPVKPGTQYTANEMSLSFFYDKDRAFIGPAGTAKTFFTPANCHWLRFNLSKNVSHRFQLNEGATATAPWPQPYKFRMDKLVVEQESQVTTTNKLGRKLNLSDAWYAWLAGKKFPIAFLGDSTTEGTGTYPGPARPAPSEDFFGVDYVRENSYSAVLERLVRKATGSTTARIYNAGYHGRNATWALANIDAILSGDLADTKMLGISHGINNRAQEVNSEIGAGIFYRDIEGIIAWALNKGIQPFLLTTQPTTMPAMDGGGATGDIEAVTNRVKRELAQKWGLEIVDISKFGKDFQTYSAHPLLSQSTAGQVGIYEAVNNTIHWGNVGHKYEAELLFAHICPRVLWTDKGEIIDFASQHLRSSVNYTNVSQLATFPDGFKIQAKFAKDDAEDSLLQEFWLFNNYRGRLSLSAYAVDAPELAYVKVNDVTTQMDSVSKLIDPALDMGLHHIEAWSGATDRVNWKGFKADTV